MTVTSATLPTRNGHPISPLSSDGLRAIFSAVEAELYRSETYHRAFARLQDQVGDAEIPQAMIRAVSREAIRLALCCLARHVRTIHRSAIAPDVSSTTHEVESSAVEVHANSTVLSVDAAIAPSSQPQPSETVETSPAPSEPIGPSRWQVTPAMTLPQPEPVDPSLDPVLQQRAAVLRQIGQDLKQTRLARSISIHELHAQTWVPIHQIKALENGLIEQLPEEIYVQGFIRRMGNALGLDGERMAASVPTLDAAKAVIPSWYGSTGTTKQSAIRPMHLYLGYTALMAGAIAGLSWMSSQTAPAGTSSVDLEPLPEPATAPVQKEARSSTAQPSTGSTTTSIASPETMPF